MFAQAAVVAFHEFKQSHPGARQWFLHEGTLQALLYSRSRKPRWTQLQIRALERIARRLVRAHRQDAKRGGEGVLSASLAKELSRHLEHQAGKPQTQVHYEWLSQGVHSGVRNVLGKRMEGDFASAKTNLIRSFGAAGAVLAAALSAQRQARQ